MSPYLDLKKQRRTPTEIWAAAAWWADGLAAGQFCVLLPGRGVCAHLPSLLTLRPVPGPSVRTPWAAKQKPPPPPTQTGLNNNDAASYKIEPHSCLCRPPLFPTPRQALRGHHPVDKCTGGRGRLLPWRLLKRENKPFFPETSPGTPSCLPAANPGTGRDAGRHDQACVGELGLSGVRAHHLHFTHVGAGDGGNT